MKKFLTILSLIYVVTGCASNVDNNYDYAGAQDDATLSFTTNFPSDTYFHVNHSKNSKSYVGGFYGLNSSNPDAIQDKKIPADKIITVHAQYYVRDYNKITKCGHAEAKFRAQANGHYLAKMYKITNKTKSWFGEREQIKCALLVFDMKTKKPINILTSKS